MKGLNVRPETIKLLEETERKNSDIRFDHYILDISPKAQHQKQKQRNETTLNLKTLLQKSFNSVKRHPAKWEKILANYVSDKQLISIIHKEMLQLKNKKQYNLKWAKDLKKHFS